MNPVHCKKEPYDLYIGRANPRAGLHESKWANPYRVDKTRANNERYRKLIILKYAMHLQRKRMWRAVHELKSKTLGCWCSPKSCHGDVLVQLADLTSKEARAKIQDIIWMMVRDLTVINTRGDTLPALYMAVCGTLAQTPQHEAVFEMVMGLHPMRCGRLLHVEGGVLGSIAGAWAVEQRVQSLGYAEVLEDFDDRHAAMANDASAFVVFWNGQPEDSPALGFVGQVWDDEDWIVWQFQPKAIKECPGVEVVYMGVRVSTLELLS